MATRVVTLEELQKHSSAPDCWIAVHGKVYNVTKFLPDHPGGGEVISSMAGADVSSEFEDVGHSDGARRQAEQYFVGVLEGTEFDGDKNITLLSQLKEKAVGVFDTRMVVFGGLAALAAAVTLYFLSNRK